jgi:hypothetical protein
VELLKDAGENIRAGIIPDVRRILKNKLAEIRLFTRLSKPCKKLCEYEGGIVPGESSRECSES